MHAETPQGFLEGLFYLKCIFDLRLAAHEKPLTAPDEHSSTKLGIFLVDQLAVGMSSVDVIGYILVVIFKEACRYTWAMR